MGKWSKITVNKLYKDYFCEAYPKLVQHVVHWSLCGYLSIEVWLDDGRVLVYNATTNRVKFKGRRESHGKSEKNNWQSNVS